MFEFDRYTENLKKHAELENKSLNSASQTEFIDKLKYISEEKRKIYLENNRILNALTPYEENQWLTPAEYEEMLAGALQLYDAFQFKDISIAHKLHKILLKNAVHEKNINKIVREIYYAGITEFYLCKTAYAFKDFFFFKIDGTLDKFNELGFEEKQLFLRAYGNRILYFTNIDVDKTLSYGLEAIRLFQQVEKDYPELYEVLQPMKLSIYRNILTCLSVFRNRKQVSKEQIDILLDIANKALEIARYNSHTSIPFDSSLNYNLHACQFHAHKISIKEFLDFLDELSTINENETTRENIQRIFRYTGNFIDYYYLYGTDLPDYQEKVKQKTQRVLNYIRQIKNQQDDVVLDNSILAFIKGTGYTIPFEALRSIILDITIFRHRATFLHTKMVLEICDILLREMLDASPEYFIGIINDFSQDMIIKNKSFILEAMRDMALFHDIGKHECIQHIKNASRRLTDLEFEIIKKHPVSGYNLLKDNPTCPQWVLDGILYHHIFYNGEKGYPQIKPSYYNNKPLVDILTVADSIDAATDYLGRCYAPKKELSVIVEELKSESGTRYAPLVVQQLEKQEIYDKIKELVNEGREKLYFESICEKNFKQ